MQLMSRRGLLLCCHEGGLQAASGFGCVSMLAFDKAGARSFAAVPHAGGIRVHTYLGLQPATPSAPAPSVRPQTLVPIKVTDQELA